MRIAPHRDARSSGRDLPLDAWLRRAFGDAAMAHVAACATSNLIDWARDAPKSLIYGKSQADRDRAGG